MLRVIPKAIRGLTPRDYEQLYTEYSEKAPNTPLMPFLYVHGGYREMWSRPDLADPALPRGMDEYMRLSIERGWTKIHPPPGPPPARVHLHRLEPAAALARAAVRAQAPVAEARPDRRGELPHEHVGAATPTTCCRPRRTTSSTASSTRQSYVPVHHRLGPGDPAARRVEDRLGDLRAASASAWRGEPASAVSRSVRGFDDRPLDLRQGLRGLHRTRRLRPPRSRRPDHADGRHPAAAARAWARSAAQEALELGAVRIIGYGAPVTDLCHLQRLRSQGHPLAAPLVRRRTRSPWPTLTGRQQFYIDHPWYLEAGESLPVHKDPPGARSRYPLRINGGHTRWSIHAIWRDHALMLRLQRGEPACFLAPVRLRAARHPRRRSRARLQRRGRLRGGGQAGRGRPAGRGDHLPRLGALSVQGTGRVSRSRWKRRGSRSTWPVATVRSTTGCSTGHRAIPHAARRWTWNSPSRGKRPAQRSPTRNPPGATAAPAIRRGARRRACRGRCRSARSTTRPSGDDRSRRRAASP